MILNIFYQINFINLKNIYSLIANKFFVFQIIPIIFCYNNTWFDANVLFLYINLDATSGIFNH